MSGSTEVVHSGTVAAARAGQILREEKIDRERDREWGRWEGRTHLGWATENKKISFCSFYPITEN
jgi:hypothetical protein